MGVAALRHRLAGWTPIDVTFEGKATLVRWCFTEGADFSAPFFDDTIDACLREPFRSAFWRVTPLADLADLARSGLGLEPSGLVFHGSRCGSTLVAQMLAGLHDVLVLSEPGPLDRMLRAEAAETFDGESRRAERLRWMISALGQPRAGESRLVVKLDAWAILQLPVIRRAFPETPSVFVYREPGEVIASHLGRRGYHMIPGTLSADLLELPDDQELSTPEQYCAAVLGQIYAAALAGAGGLRLVNYDELPAAVAGRIAPLFGIEVGPNERESFDARSRRDAKNPAVPFDAAAAGSSRRTGPAVVQAVERHALRWYEELEAVRAAQC